MKTAASGVKPALPPARTARTRRSPARWSTHRERCQQCGRCIEACYAGALFLYGRAVSVASLMAELRQDEDFYRASGGGITLSGGEPLAQAGFAIELLRQCQAEGFATALDTCGSVPWATLEAALPYTDLVLYDLKPLDPAIHKQFTGVSNAVILENLRRLDRIRRAGRNPDPTDPRRDGWRQPGCGLCLSENTPAPGAGAAAALSPHGWQQVQAAGVSKIVCPKSRHLQAAKCRPPRASCGAAVVQLSWNNFRSEFCHEQHRLSGVGHI